MSPRKRRCRQRFGSLRSLQVALNAGVKLGARVGGVHEKARSGQPPRKPTPGFVGAPVESASEHIDAKIKELGDWRGKMLAKVRAIIHQADPEIVEEVKWRGTPVFSHGGIVCTGETYKNVVKMTFAKGARVEGPCRSV